MGGCICLDLLTKGFVFWARLDDAFGLGNLHAGVTLESLDNERHQRGSGE